MKDSSNGSGQRVRRHFSPQQKAAFVKAHLVDKTPLSDLCDKHQIQVAQFYQWQKQLFEHADAAFERQGKKSGKSAHERKIYQLQAKLVNKNEFLAEDFKALYRIMWAICRWFIVPVGLL